MFGSGADESGRQRARESGHRARSEDQVDDVPLDIREAHGKQLSVFVVRPRTN